MTDAQIYGLRDLLNKIARLSRYIETEADRDKRAVYLSDLRFCVKLAMDLTTACRDQSENLRPPQVAPEL